MAEFIRPSYEIVSEIPEDLLQTIERIGRVCYKSEDKISLTSAVSFVQSIMKRGHLSVIEHVSMSIRFICDRGVSHELVRHRLASFSQECLSGDTEIRKGLTIKDLYERSIGSPQDKTHNKTIRLRSSDSSGQVIPNHFKQIWRKGNAPVFELVTSLGYKIKATANHKFQLPTGSFVKLSTLCVGDSVMVNGRPCLLTISDAQLEEEYQTKSPIEIADDWQAPYGSVIRRLKQLGIFVTHKNDKEKVKYNKNHTRQSYLQARLKIIEQYKNGRSPWNKGISEHESESVRRQGETLRKYHWNNLSSDRNSNWKGGVSTQVYIKKKQNEVYCALCREFAHEVHHVNKNRADNSDCNLLKVCRNCHSKLHHGWWIGKSTHPDQIIAISLVGVEEVFDIEMEAPYHNFIANGFVVHNSSRYCDYNKKGLVFIIPSWSDLEPMQVDSGNVFRLTSAAAPTIALTAALLISSDPKNLLWVNAMQRAEVAYNELRVAGWKPEQARSVLPNSLKTELVMTANLREWRHILKLRTALAAHPQMRELMVPLLAELKQRVPVIFDDILSEGT